MITVGDIEMESPVSKIFRLASSVVIMPSDDDAALHAEIMNNLYYTISDLVDQLLPASYVSVREVVDLYINEREKVRLKRAERELLAPLGLTRENFPFQQSIMQPTLVDRVAEDMVRYKLPAMSALIVGIDLLGSHIYEVHDGESGCLDTMGYAAIGAGTRHARAHFMMSGQSGHSSIAETLWATYLAKKRSEVAPGSAEQPILPWWGLDPAKAF